MGMSRIQATKVYDDSANNFDQDKGDQSKGSEELPNCIIVSAPPQDLSHLESSKFFKGNIKTFNSIRKKDQ